MNQPLRLMWLKAIASCLLDYETKPCICIGEEDHVGFLGLLNSRRSAGVKPSRPPKTLLGTIEDLDTGDLPGNVWISKHLQGIESAVQVAQMAE